MNRRSFFRLLGTGAGVVAAAPLVRTWPFRVYSIPASAISPGNWYYDSIIQIQIHYDKPNWLIFYPNSQQAEAYEKLFARLKRQDHEARSKEIKNLYLSRSKFTVTEVNQDEKSITLASASDADHLHFELTRAVDDLQADVSRFSDHGKRADDSLNRWLGIRPSRRDDDRHI